MKLIARGRALWVAGATALALTGGCVPENGGSGTSAAPPGAAPPGVGPPGGLAPPPGRTEAERQARRAYYQGPRGDEF